MVAVETPIHRPHKEVLEIIHHNKKSAKKRKINAKFMQLSKHCNTQQIVSEYEKLTADGTKCSAGTHIIAQKALIQTHCQNKHIRSAKQVWNDLVANDAYKSKLKHIDYYMIMSSFLSNRYTRSALHIFEQMVYEHGVAPDTKLWNVAIKACAQMQSLTKANELYTLIEEKEPKLLNEDEFIQNSLIDMYLKCNDMQKAKNIFESIENKQNTVLWNILLNGMIQSNDIEEAINFFDQMIKKGVARDHFTFSCVSKAISSTKSLQRANDLYDMMQNEQNIDIMEHASLCNSFISMFGKCGDLDKSVSIWEGMKVKKDIISWNSFMNANYWNANYQKVKDLYVEMMNDPNNDSLRPQLKTFSICIRSCIESKDKEFGNRLYEDVMSAFEDMKHKDVFHSLVDMFYLFDGVNKAICVWRKIVNDKPSLMGFTYMINLCVQNGDYLKAFELFDEMQNQHWIKPDAAIFRVMIKACGSSKEMIDAMFEQIVDSGCIDDKRLVSILMTAYNLCGDKQNAGRIWKIIQNRQKK